MRIPGKRVAILSPVAWRTPPRQYGAWETVAGNISEGLVARGWNVTLFATRDSATRAHLHAVVDKGYEEDPSIDPKVAEYLHISEIFEHASDFDLIQACAGDHLVFLGRIHPDKGVHLAIEVARRSGLPLVIAGIIQDQTYFREQVQPHLDHKIRYIGPVDVPGKNELFARALALLHLNTIPERFGLVLAEANAAGVPVIAMDLGSCREVIKDGETGFLVANIDQAVQALERIHQIDRSACRKRVQHCFSVETMVEAYERVYAAIFDLEARKLS
jgi:glycosyltransferase involved in cell wall biosynthesis